MPRWVMFCEARGDFRTASGLIDRALRARCADWVGALLEHAPDGAREWVPDDQGNPFFDLHTVYKVSRAKGISMRRGHFGDAPSLPGATLLVQAVRIAMTLEVVPDAVVVVWDMDKQGDARRSGLAQGRNAANALFGERGIVIGCPDPNREAWVLVGFDAEDDNERRRLADERSALGFWPHESPERLTAQDETAVKHTKRVLRTLTGGDGEREARCWTHAPYDTLRARGTGCGLTDFFDEVEEHLVRQADPSARR